MEELISNEIKSEKIYIKSIKYDFDYQNDSVLIKTLLKEPGANIILFIIDNNQGLMEHSASKDALIYVLEGKLDFMVSNQNYRLSEGSILKLTAQSPHSFTAVERTKMLLILFT